jgi:glycosyltransferase involved in cell wall biosynthesis
VGGSSIRRLRVAYVYRHFNDDSSLPSIFRERAQRLAADADVTVFASADTRAATSAPLRFESVEPMVVGGGRITYAVECASFAVRATRRLRQLRDRFDVIHVDGFAAATADLVMVHAVRPAEVEHYFESVEPAAGMRRRLTPVLRPQTGVVMAIERRLFRPPFPMCLVLSRQIGDDLKHHYGVPEELIQVQPYGIDRNLFSFNGEARARERAAHGASDDRLVLLFVGDDFERKGLERAIGSLAASPSAELWVVGGGPAGPYRSLAGSLGVSERVRFLGRMERDRVAALLSAADVLVLPSHQDAWGHPVIEAMAAGRPAIVSEFAGSHEAVDNGVNGYVIEGSGATEQIAALLAGPLASPEFRADMGARAADAARAFDADAVHERFVAAHHRAAALRGERLRTR